MSIFRHMKIRLTQLRRVIRETVEESLKKEGLMLREDAMRVATAAADVVEEPGELGVKLFHLFSRFDERDLKDFISLPQEKGIKLMMQLGIDPATAKSAWLKTWQAASAIAYPDEYTDAW